MGLQLCCENVERFQCGMPPAPTLLPHPIWTGPHTTQARAVAEEVEQQKKAKYADLTTTHNLSQSQLRSQGSMFGPKAHVTFTSLVAASWRRQASLIPTMQCLLQTIAVAIQSGNGAAVLGTSPPSAQD